MGIFIVSRHTLVDATCTVWWIFPYSWHNPAYIYIYLYIYIFIIYIYLFIYLFIYLGFWVSSKMRPSSLVDGNFWEPRGRKAPGVCPRIAIGTRYPIPSARSSYSLLLKWQFWAPFLDPHHILVGGLEWFRTFLKFSHEYWVAVIIPIDELIFFRGVAKNHQPVFSWFINPIEAPSLP